MQGTKRHMPVVGAQQACALTCTAADIELSQHSCHCSSCGSCCYCRLSSKPRPALPLPYATTCKLLLHIAPPPPAHLTEVLDGIALRCCGVLQAIRQPQPPVAQCLGVPGCCCGAVQLGSYLLVGSHASAQL
jgi:hypothetical protein